MADRASTLALTACAAALLLAGACSTTETGTRVGQGGSGGSGAGATSVSSTSSAGAGCPGAARAGEFPEGVVWCPDGALDRHAAVACPFEPPDRPCRGTEAHQFCSDDAGCTLRGGGRCTTKVETDECSCQYPDCQTDDDCYGGVCWCQPGRDATCIAASCRTDVDCPSGECGVSVWNDGCDNVVAVQCRAPTDACHAGCCSLGGDVVPAVWGCYGLGECGG